MMAQSLLDQIAGIVSIGIAHITQADMEVRPSRPADGVETVPGGQSAHRGGAAARVRGGGRGGSSHGFSSFSSSPLARASLRNAPILRTLR